MLLMVSGHTVATTYTGNQAFVAVEKLKPDVAFLDIGLPDVDGYALARMIRAEPWGTKVLLVAITGYGRPEDQRKAKVAGFDYHFTKPVVYEKLEQLLDRLSP